MNSSHEWTTSVLNTIFGNYQNLMQLYGGEAGARRLAREYGFGLAFCSEGEKYIQASYGWLAVQVYTFNPPIDAPTWHEEVRRGYNKALKQQEGSGSDG